MVHRSSGKKEEKSLPTGKVSPVSTDKKWDFRAEDKVDDRKFSNLNVISWNEAFLYREG